MFDGIYGKLVEERTYLDKHDWKALKEQVEQTVNQGEIRIVHHKRWFGEELDWIPSCLSEEIDDSGLFFTRVRDVYPRRVGSL